MSNLDLWLNRPYGEKEREQHKLQAAHAHMFNCPCEPCSDKRRAMCDSNATNHTRLIADEDRHAIDIADRVVAVGVWLLGLIAAVAIIAHIFVPVIDRMVSL